MGIFSCDHEDCERKPYMECFEISDKEDGEIGKWWYFCFWHYVWVRFRNLFYKDEKLGFARVDTEREAIEHIRMELWDIQTDLMLIKEKLKIKEQKIYDEEKQEDKGFV